MFFTKLTILSGHCRVITVKTDDGDQLTLSGEWKSVHEKEKTRVFQCYVRFPCSGFTVIRVSYTAYGSEYEDPITLYANQYKPEYVYDLARLDEELDFSC